MVRRWLLVGWLAGWYIVSFFFSSVFYASYFYFRLYIRLHRVLLLSFSPDLPSLIPESARLSLLLTFFFPLVNSFPSDPVLTWRDSIHTSFATERRIKHDEV